MRQALLGTGGGTQQQWKINALGETEQILVTRGAGNTTKLFELGLDYSAGGNNGNVKSLSIDTGANQFTQYFRYDGANRLQLAVENPTTPTGTTCAAAGGAWCQQLAYDGFGNLWQAAGVGNVVAGMPASKDRYWHAAVGATPAKVDNRFDGAEYDGSGNLRQYGMTGSMRANYDAEGRRAARWWWRTITTGRGCGSGRRWVRRKRGMFTVRIGS